MNDLQLLIVTVFLGGLTYYLVRYIGRVFKNASTNSKTEQPVSDISVNDRAKIRQTDNANKKNQAKEAPEVKAQLTSTVASKKGGKGSGKEKVPTFTHPWLMTNLKGHTGRVLDFSFSENGKMVASCAEDRSLLFWFVKDFSNKEHKSVRANVAFDHGSKIKWSPDSKAVVIYCAQTNELQVHKLGKKDDGAYTVQHALSFKSGHTDISSDVIGMDMSSSGKFIMTCTNKNELALYDIRGEVLTRIDTCQMTTYTARISPCGRFVATSGFTPDVKVWEVKISRSGEFEKISRAFELTGHKSGIYHFAFNADSSRIVTLSKDGKFRIFTINVDYRIGQEPHLVSSGQVEVADLDSKVCLSSDGQIVAVSHRSDVYFYSGVTGKKLDKIGDVHSESITAIAFDAESRWLLTSGDKHIRVIYNVPGYRQAILDAQDKLKQATSEGMKERLTQQIQTAKDQLKKIEG